MYFSAQNRKGIFDFPPHNNQKLSSSSIHHLAGLCPVHLFCQHLGFAVPLQRQEAGWLPRRERIFKIKCPGECTYGYVDLSSSLGRGQSLAAYLTRKPSKVQQHLLSLLSQARKSGGENAFQCFRIDCFSPADAQTRAVTIG